MLSTRSRAFLNRLRKQLKATAMPAVRFKNGRNRRSLIVELLALQLAFAVFVSIIAIGGLWWTSKWVIDDNLAKWGQQWISQLDDLGVPLYTSQDPERYLSIEQYINTFPEIGLVRYYSPDAKVIFESAAPENLAAIKRLSVDSLQDLAGGLGSKSSAGLDSPIEDLPYVRISKAVWTESIVSDGLLDFDPATEQAVQAELVGFVEVPGPAESEHPERQLAQHHRADAAHDELLAHFSAGPAATLGASAALEEAGRWRDGFQGQQLGPQGNRCHSQRAQHDGDRAERA
jgi:hypothetical protein